MLLPNPYFQLWVAKTSSGNEVVDSARPSVEDIESALQRKMEGGGRQMPTVGGENVVARK